MKKLYPFLIMAVMAVSVKAQDTIVFRNGDELQVKVTDVTDSQIMYHLRKDLNGPVYTKNISDILMVKYENGDKVVYGQPDSKSQDFEHDQQPSEQPDTSSSEKAADAKKDTKTGKPWAGFLRFPFSLYDGTNGMCFGGSIFGSHVSDHTSLMWGLEYRRYDKGSGKTEIKSGTLVLPITYSINLGPRNKFWYFQIQGGVNVSYLVSMKYGKEEYKPSTSDRFGFGAHVRAVLFHIAFIEYNFSFQKNGGGSLGYGLCISW